MSDELKCKTGPLGPEKFENDPPLLSREDLAKLYSPEELKKDDELIEAIRASVKEDK